MISAEETEETLFSWNTVLWEKKIQYQPVNGIDGYVANWRLCSNRKGLWPLRTGNNEGGLTEKAKEGLLWKNALAARRSVGKFLGSRVLIPLQVGSWNAENGRSSVRNGT